MPRYLVAWSDEAKLDFRRLRPFHQPLVMRAIDELEHGAEVRTRHRKALEEPLEELPEASWQVAVTSLRVLYWIDAGKLVRVLRIIEKGRKTTGQALRSGGTR